MELAATEGASPLTSRGESTRERILQSAASVLADKGYSGTTLAGIAAQAQTKAGSLYYYFDSREELISEIMTRGITETHAHVKGAVEFLPAEASSRDRLAAAITAHVRYMLTENDIARASIRTLGQAPPEVQGPAIALHRIYGQYLAQLIEDVQADGYLLSQANSRVLRLLMVGAANWTTAWYNHNGSASVEEIAELLAQMVLGELAGPGRDGPT